MNLIDVLLIVLAVVLVVVGLMSVASVVRPTFAEGGADGALVTPAARSSSLDELPWCDEIYRGSAPGPTPVPDPSASPVCRLRVRLIHLAPGEVGWQSIPEHLKDVLAPGTGP